MRTVASQEAQATFLALLAEVGTGESITITEDGRPVAVLTPAVEPPRRDVKEVIAQIRALSAERARRFGHLSAAEFQELIEEGRR